MACCTCSGSISTGSFSSMAKARRCQSSWAGSWRVRSANPLNSNPAPAAASRAADRKPGSNSGMIVKTGVFSGNRSEMFFRTACSAAACQFQSYRRRWSTDLKGAAVARPHNQPLHSAERLQKAWLGRGRAVTTAAMDRSFRCGARLRIGPSNRHRPPVSQGSAGQFSIGVGLPFPDQSSTPRSRANQTFFSRKRGGNANCLGRGRSSGWGHRALASSQAVSISASRSCRRSGFNDRPSSLLMILISA